MNSSDTIKFEPLSDGSESYDEAWSDEDEPLKVEPLSDVSEGGTSRSTAASKAGTPNASKTNSVANVLDSEVDAATPIDGGGPATNGDANDTKASSTAVAADTAGVPAPSPALLRASKTKKKERRVCDLCKSGKGKRKAKLEQDGEQREIIVCKPCLGEIQTTTAENGGDAERINSKLSALMRAAPNTPDAGSSSPSMLGSDGKKRSSFLTFRRRSNKAMSTDQSTSDADSTTSQKRFMSFRRRKNTSSTNLSTSTTPSQSPQLARDNSVLELFSGPVFGQSIGDVLRFERGKEKRAEARVPFLIEVLCERISAKWLDEPGLFRVAGANSQVVSMMQTFQHCYVSGDFDASTVPERVDPHVLTSVLKKYLRSTPTPMFPVDEYRTILEIADLGGADKQAERISRLRSHIDALDEDSRAVLHFLVDFLRRIAEQSAVNMMHASNLAIIFGPAWLRSGDGDDAGVLDEAVQINRVNAVAEDIIRHGETLFGGGGGGGADTSSNGASDKSNRRGSWVEASPVLSRPNSSDSATGRRQILSQRGSVHENQPSGDGDGGGVCSLPDTEQVYKFENRGGGNSLLVAFDVTAQSDAESESVRTESDDTVKDDMEFVVRLIAGRRTVHVEVHIVLPGDAAATADGVDVGEHGRIEVRGVYTEDSVREDGAKVSVQKKRVESVVSPYALEAIRISRVDAGKTHCAEIALVRKR